MVSLRVFFNDDTEMKRGRQSIILEGFILNNYNKKFEKVIKLDVT